MVGGRRRSISRDFIMFRRWVKGTGARRIHRANYEKRVWMKGGIEGLEAKFIRAVDTRWRASIDLVASPSQRPAFIPLPLPLSKWIINLRHDSPNPQASDRTPSILTG